MTGESYDETRVYVEGITEISFLPLGEVKFVFFVSLLDKIAGSFAKLSVYLTLFKGVPIISQSQVFIP
jgi:hypothetical protein